MAKTKKQGENSACSALFERAYYSSGYGIFISLYTKNALQNLIESVKGGNENQY